MAEIKKGNVGMREGWKEGKIERLGDGVTMGRRDKNIGRL
jgi:hypothetical protein